MYVRSKLKHHELVDNIDLNELSKRGIKYKVTKDRRVFAINPTNSQLEWLAKRELLKGVCVIYDLKDKVYEVVPKPAAILCKLTGTCKIIKEFPNATEAYLYLQNKLKL